MREEQTGLHDGERGKEGTRLRHPAPQLAEDLLGCCLRSGFGHEPSYMILVEQDGSFGIAGPRSNASGPFQLSPNMTLSFLMIVMVGLFGGVALVCRATRLTEAPGWEWSAFVFPARAFDWCLVGLHCICALGAWLATGAGYATTRAGMVAFLQLTELPWVYVLDISALGEPTNALKSVGSAIVFASAVAAGCGDGRKAA